MTSPLNSNGNNIPHLTTSEAFVAPAVVAKNDPNYCGFQSMFPNASPEELKKIVGGFINNMISDMRAQQQRALAQLKKLAQNDPDDSPAD